VEEELARIWRAEDFSLFMTRLLVGARMSHFVLGRSFIVRWKCCRNPNGKFSIFCGMRN
jgi:hypothetical protein